MYQINIKAIGIAVFLGLILPYVIIWGVTYLAAAFNSMAIFQIAGVASLFWLFLFSPLVTGYLAAKNSTIRPLFHGLIAVIPLITLYVYKNHSSHGWYTVIIILILLMLSLVGARRFKIEYNN